MHGVKGPEQDLRSRDLGFAALSMTPLTASSVMAPLKHTVPDDSRSVKLVRQCQVDLDVLIFGLLWCGISQAIARQTVRLTPRCLKCPEAFPLWSPISDAAECATPRWSPESTGTHSVAMYAVKETWSINRRFYFCIQITTREKEMLAAGRNLWSLQIPAPSVQVPQD